MDMVLETQQLSLFDYASLDTDTRLFVQGKAQAIHTRLKRTAEDIIAIGLDLKAVKARLEESNNHKRGLFLDWVQSEFGMSRMSAVRFMQVAEKFGKCNKLLHNFAPSVLYELASPSTPDTVIEMVETGQILPTLPAIREAKRELQQEQQASLTQAELQALEPRPGPIFGPVHQPLAPSISVVSDEPFSILKQRLKESGIDPDDVDWEEDEEEEETEEDRYITAVDTGTLDYYYADLRRGAILRDEEERAQRRGVPAALLSSESNEWYTPARYIDAARELMERIDLDPASNAFANQVVQATSYYDIDTNGLEQPWRGRVWLNPPYGFTDGKSNQEVWTHRLIEQFKAGITTEAVLLVNANTEAKWFQPLYNYLICFTNHRIRFYNTSGESSQPTQGNALVYFGKQGQRFIELFCSFGAVVRMA